MSGEKEGSRAAAERSALDVPGNQKPVDDATLSFVPGDSPVEALAIGRRFLLADYLGEEAL
jgi:hypothetical protein